MHFHHRAKNIQHKGIRWSISLSARISLILSFIFTSMKIHRFRHLLTLRILFIHLHMYLISLQLPVYHLYFFQRSHGFCHFLPVHNFIFVYVCVVCLHNFYFNIYFRFLFRTLMVSLSFIYYYLRLLPFMEEHKLPTNILHSTTIYSVYSSDIYMYP